MVIVDIDFKIFFLVFWLHKIMASLAVDVNFTDEQNCGALSGVTEMVITSNQLSQPRNEYW